MCEQFKTLLPSSVYKMLKNESNENAYQIYGLHLKKVSTEELKTVIKNKQFGFKSPVFDEFEKTQREHDDFLCNPVNVVEGIVVCACGSKRTFSTQKQTRGSDEPLTTFSRCVDCEKTWSYSG